MIEAMRHNDQYAVSFLNEKSYCFIPGAGLPVSILDADAWRWRADKVHVRIYLPGTTKALEVWTPAANINED